MAEKKPQIVIKKITVVSGGAHGGAWKVAFADFMTAMMAFFLVMWLVSSASEAQKKAISDYFSTPSVIEYQFNNYGAQLTLEKLFLDLVNEPLKVFQAFVTPVDRTPNVMAMGMKKVVMAYMAEQLGESAASVDASADAVVFEIPDESLFVRGTADPTAEFVDIMERVKGVTMGLEDAEVEITSVVSVPSVRDGSPRTAKNVSEQRLDMIHEKVKSSIESDSVEVIGRSLVRNDDYRGEKGVSGGYIRFEFRQKKVTPDGRTQRPISDGVFAGADKDKSVYDNFVKQVSKKKQRPSETERR